MKPRDRRRHKGRREGGTFTAIPQAVQDSDNWRQCSATAVKMLCDLTRQYTGRNNGDLCGALTTLRPYGWKHDETIGNALRELRHYGFILLTRQGGLGIGPNLYALAWRAIDECGGKLQEVTPGQVAPGGWKEPKPPYRRPTKVRKEKQNATTPSVADSYAIRSSGRKKAA